VLLAGFLSAPLVSVLIALALFPGRTYLFYAAFLLLGLLCMPIMPTVVATAAETMYPVMETYSTGVLVLVRGGRGRGMRCLRGRGGHDGDGSDDPTVVDPRPWVTG
jgi:hypothetical protein